MGRRKTPTAPTQPEFDAAAISEDLDKADARTKQLAVIDERFGGIEPYQRERVMAEAMFFKRQAGQSSFELGKRLILLKEHEGHGNFLPALEALKIGARTAQRLMVTAAKFGKYDHLTHLNQSKLLEMSMWDDSALEELDQGGTVAGLTFEKIDEMSLSELKEQLKKAEEENADLVDLVAKKDEKINKLDRTLRKLPEVRAFSDETKELHKLIVEYGVGMEDAISQFHQLFDDLSERINAADPSAAEQESVAFSTVNAIERSVNRMRDLQEQVYHRFDGFITARYNAMKSEQAD